MPQSLFSQNPGRRRKIAFSNTKARLFAKTPGKRNAFAGTFLLCGAYPKGARQNSMLPSKTSFVSPVRMMPLSL